VLSVPCWVLADAYHAALLSATSLLLGLTLPRQAGGEIEVHATQVLGIFAAMCLASVRAPMDRRLRALVIGLPVLFGIELLTGVVAIRTEILAQTGGGLPHWLLKFRDEELIAPPWLGAPLVWLLLLGRWEFPILQFGDRAAGVRGVGGTSSPRAGRRAAMSAAEQGRG
jgi:hypothetical protein